MNKKLAGIFAICALLLTGCQGAKESSKEITPPDTGWGKTVDEVLADWNLDRDQVEIFSETESAAAIAVDTEATVFGEQTSRVMFQFINLDQTGATGKPVLCEVDITYPDDADMDTVKKEMEKLERNLGGIKDMEEIPGVIFLVDPKKERIAILEARKLNIPVIGLVDTNCNPEDVDYAIPGNDDAIRAVKLIADTMANAVIEGRQGETIEVTSDSEDAMETEEATAPTDMEEVVEEYLASKYWFYRSKKYTRKYGNYTKEINLISGQFYFILLLLYFYNCQLNSFLMLIHMLLLFELLLLFLFLLFL